MAIINFINLKGTKPFIFQKSETKTTDFNVYSLEKNLKSL